MEVKVIAGESGAGGEGMRSSPTGLGRILIFSGTMAGNMKKLVRTLEEFNEEAVSFAGTLVPKAGAATLVTLSGELGAGKTAFTKAVAQALGVGETVNSPTFVLEKIYKLGHPASQFERLVHIDAYRLEKGSDLAPLGFDEIMQDSHNLIFLEWPEKVAEVLPKPSVEISIVILADGGREISYG